MKEKINLKKEFLNNQMILLFMSKKDSPEILIDITKQLSGKNICYVTLDKTFDSLKEFFKKNKINIGNIVFIDAISNVIQNPPDQTANCYFLDSPHSLQELSLKINKFLRHKFDYLIFDSFAKYYFISVTASSFLAVPQLRESERAILYLEPIQKSLPSR